MNRDEILKMAQKENPKNDERELFIQTKGYSYGSHYIYTNIKWRRKRLICFVLYVGELQLL